MEILNAILYAYLFLVPTLILLVILKRVYDSLHFETQYTISKFFSNLCWPYRNFRDQSERFFFWGFSMRKVYDWDFLGIYQVLVLKLKRLKKCIEQGNATDAHKKKILKPLNECLRILDRLINNDYDDYSKVVEEKWGQIHLTFHPSENPNLSKGYFYHDKAYNPTEQKIADKEFSKAMDKDWKQEEKDRIKLFTLIGIHIEKWWD